MNNVLYRIHADPNTIPVVHSDWYPPVRVEEKNSEYAQMLMPDLASATSEMTTVHQYLFQSWTVSRENKAVCRVIGRMAKVEQHHFSIIGQLIALLGDQPECRSTGPSSYWCGNMVNYSCDLHELLSANAESERFAAQTYTAQSKEIKDPFVSKMLARLAMDEKLHYKIFCDFLSQT